MLKHGIKCYKRHLLQTSAIIVQLIYGWLVISLRQTRGLLFWYLSTTPLWPTLQSDRYKKSTSGCYLFTCGINGARGQTWTGTPRKARDFKSLASTDSATRAKWSGKRGSNSRPRPWQGRALPTELFPQLKTLLGSSVLMSAILKFFYFVSNRNC